MIKEVKWISVIDSFTLASYVIFKIQKASHLKIQKLLYYIQWFHLAYFDEPIIKDDFQAWVHGPVSRVLFDKLKLHSLIHTEIEYKRNDWEEDIEENIKSLISQEQFELINEVLKAYWDLSWLELENLTHNETPWKETRQWFSNWEKCEKIIPKELLKSFFKEELYG